MSPTWKRPPLPEETFSASFGEGEGELLTLVYPKPLPMRPVSYTHLTLPTNKAV